VRLWLCGRKVEYPDVFGRPSVQQLASRLRRAATPLANALDVSDPWRQSEWSTVVHGDFKVQPNILASDHFLSCPTVPEPHTDEGGRGDGADGQHVLLTRARQNRRAKAVGLRLSMDR
jgi:hypothetical protein